jgi:ATP-binding cassette subfamily C protein LapB
MKQKCSHVVRNGSLTNKMARIENMDNENGLLQCLARLAVLQHESIDRIALQEAVALAGEGDARMQLSQVIRHLRLPEGTWQNSPDPAKVPMLVSLASWKWGVLRGQNATGEWVIETWNNEELRLCEESRVQLTGIQFATVRLTRAFTISDSPSWQLISQEVFSQKRRILEAAVGGIAINLIALATSFYSLQVYDRVVPTGAFSTLLVLTLGVTLAILYEFFAKTLRGRLYDRLVEQIDRRLAHAIYSRFLSLRLDQLPRSVGGLAGQMRGYETVRSFMTGMTTHLLVDAPFALLFVLVIAAMASYLAVIPLFFLIFSLGIGLFSWRYVDVLANTANMSNNFKTGLLVETVEGAETIKAGQGGWRMLSRWIRTTDEARDAEQRMRSVSERSQYLVAAFQQTSYVLMIASGALMISRGELTMGGLIACSILSGRVLTPVAMIPSQLVQWAHVRAALKGLDRLWLLEDDHHGQAQPLILETIAGNYRLENIVVDYGGRAVLTVPHLQISAGEKVAVLGSVGAGKTTLIRVLSGMYKPQSGRVFLDDIDMAHISKPVLAEQMGYVQQDARLFAGTLRDNLVLGLIDPGDEAVLKAAQTTGLLQMVISQHPQGLQLPIYEGGVGLSSGQRQLVNLTRAFLRKPKIWLLDEPTASMDRNLEIQVIRSLQQALAPTDTLVLVTHKGELLELVDRIIVIANHGVALDGPKDMVLRQLTGAHERSVPQQAAAVRCGSPAGVGDAL